MYTIWSLTGQVTFIPQNCSVLHEILYNTIQNSSVTLWKLEYSIILKDQIINISCFYIVKKLVLNYL